MKSETAGLVTISKSFYDRGVQELSLRIRLNSMLAVCNFHDAVEFMFRALMYEFIIPKTQSDNFQQMRKAIDAHFKSDTSPRILPLDTEIEFLNTERTKIKHMASVPSQENCERFRVFTVDFLEICCRQYFDTEFESVSVVLTLDEGTCRTLLIDAERAISAELWSEALELIVNAYRSGRPQTADLINPGHRRFGQSMSFGHIMNMPSGIGNLTSTEKAIREIGKKVEEHHKAIETVQHDVERLEDLLALVAAGIDLSGYWRYQAVSPAFYLGHTDWSKTRNGEPITGDHVQIAFSFVLNALQRWQALGLLCNEE